MPDDSFLRFEDDECDIYLPILERVYRYESNQISGSHGGGRRHTQLRWTRQDMLNFVVADVREDAVLVAQRETWFDELIERMVAEKHLMRYASGGETYHATRVGELVRNITCLHEFQERDGVNDAEELIDMRYSIMDGIRWEPRLRLARPGIPPERLVRHFLIRSSPTMSCRTVFPSRTPWKIFEPFLRPTKENLVASPSRNFKPIASSRNFQNHGMDDLTLWC